MGLAIDGNVVNGIARGGQAFVPVEQLPQISSDGSITYNGKQYDPKLKVTAHFADNLNSLLDDRGDNYKNYFLAAKDLDCTKYFGKKAMLFYYFKYSSSEDNPYKATATEVFELQQNTSVASCTGDGEVGIHANPSGNDTDSGFVIGCGSQIDEDKMDAGMLLLIFN